jgi:hypothetical protein
MWLQCDVAGFGRGEHARAVTADVVGPTIAGAPANIEVVSKSPKSSTAKAASHPCRRASEAGHRRLHLRDGGAM